MQAFALWKAASAIQHLNSQEETDLDTHVAKGCD